MKLKRMVNRIWKFISDKNYRFLFLADYGIYKNLADSEFLCRKFLASVGYPLNLSYPRSFNEKLQWLKLYDRNPLYTKLVDKYEVKAYIADIIGEKYIIPTLKVWESPDKIDMNELPNSFVLKTTHDSGGVVVCKDKNGLDIKSTLNIIQKSYNNDYYVMSREWPYKDVKRRVIAEKYLHDDNNSDCLTDYKFMCFNGKCKCIFTGTDRFTEDGLQITFYDTEWNILPFKRHYPARKTPGPKPKNLSLMIELAEKIAKDLPFVRVDLYETSGNIYFSEVTFFPGSGFEEFTPQEWDYKLGEWIVLPEKRGI